MPPITPWVTWGASYAQTWTFPAPVDNPVPRPVMAGQSLELKSGLLDVWEDRTDHELSITVHLIPRLTIGSVTGFEPANGVSDALEWLQRGGIGRFYTAAGVYKPFQLVGFNPKNDIERSQGGARFSVRMTLRSTDAKWTAY